MAITVEEVGSSSLSALREEWDALVEEAADATIYQTWEWNDAWWHAFSRDKRLQLLLVRNDSCLIGIGPFYIGRHLGTPLRRLAFLGTGPSDYLTVIAATGKETEVYEALLAYLLTHDGYDLADLQQVPEGTPFLKWLREVAPERNAAKANGVTGSWQVHVRPIEACPTVALPASYDAYLHSLSKRTRENVRYYTRLALRELPGASFDLCSAEDLASGMESLFRLHQRRWRQRMMPGCFGSRRSRQFHMDVASRFMKRGWLRLHVLRSVDQILAALYCFAFRDRYYYYLGGFEPDLHRYSLGTILTAAAVRQAIEEGCTSFDFLRGNEAYKERWKPAVRTNYQCLIARRRDWRSEAMLALNRIERYVEHRAKAFSDRGKGVRR